jgi:CheY-like chemotaxis protein
MPDGFRILLVEDDPAEVRLVQEGLNEGRTQCDLQVFYTGEAALEFAFRQGKWRDASRPNLIILDLNLPGMSGIEILRCLKGDKRTRAIPVIMFSSSGVIADVNRCYDLHANCYIQKPADLTGVYQVIRSIENFWTNVAQTPS